MWRKLFAVGIGLMGVVYFAQGTGLFTQVASFMNNNTTWAIIGIVLIIAGLLLWPAKNKPG